MARATAASKSPSKYFSMRWGRTSVSVCETSWWPSAARHSRSSLKLLMTPLCTTAIRPAQSTWGWALTIEGTPWVAQRVCPMPAMPSRDRQRPGQGLDADGVLEDLDALPGNGDAAGVVAAVLQLAQAVQEYRLGPFVTYIPDDAAHEG